MYYAVAVAVEVLGLVAAVVACFVVAYAAVAVVLHVKIQVLAQLTYFVAFLAGTWSG